MSLRKIFIILLALIVSVHARSISSFNLLNETQTVPKLAGNGITDIQYSDGVMWFGTGYGLSRSNDFGQTFETFLPSSGIGEGSISALWASHDTIWVATASDTLTAASDNYLDNGTGLSVSVDNGLTWKHFKQPGTTSVQNLTYDIAINEGIVWITSWGGGIQKSSDWGETWQVCPPDSFIFDPGKNLNHRGFSVVSSGDAVWVGTADGINRTTDKGESWEHFKYDNQQQPISGNFVVALACQNLHDRSIIWAATWKATGENEFYGISYTDNSGKSWKTALEGEKAHNFAFDGDIVYVATDNGLFKSIDLGQNWYLMSDFQDSESNDRIYTSTTYSAFALSGDLWIGTSDGLARTRNNGFSWKTYRSFVPTGLDDEPRTYAYPNPFSPQRHNQYGDDGFIRIQFNTLKNTQATIRVYDFSMDLVATVVDSRQLLGPEDHAIVWNARNDYGDLVANGVYFYSVDLNDDGVYWGKIIILN